MKWDISSYRTCLKCGQYKYIHVGSIPDIVNRFFLQQIYFLTQFINIHTHFLLHTCSVVAVLHRHVFSGIFDGWFYEFIRFFYRFIDIL